VYFDAFAMGGGGVPIATTTQLSYSFHPEQENGRHVAVDFVLRDGSTLRDSGATALVNFDGDRVRVGMHPGAAKGTVGQTTQIFCEIGEWLAGRTIDRILIAYDNVDDATGEFSAFLDDLQIVDRNVNPPMADTFENGVSSPSSAGDSFCPGFFLYEPCRCSVQFLFLFYLVVIPAIG
jgi:hypothetical protein